MRVTFLIAALALSLGPAAWDPSVAAGTSPRGGAGAVAGKSALSIQPARPRQGDFLVISLPEGAGDSVTGTFLGKQIPFRRHEGRWLGFAAVKLGTAAGSHRLSVRIGRGGGSQTVSQSVPVAKVAFATQKLSMSGRTSSLYSYPGVKKEDALVGSAIRAFSSELRMEGDWILPVTGRRSTPFGVQRIRNGRRVGFHRGLDFAVPLGTPIRAPANGRVVLSSSLRKHGKTVVLDHGLGVTSLYMHMSALGVKKGQTVRKGDILGKVGSTGVSTGPHLHWAVYAQGTAGEPLFMVRMSARGVRLAGG